MPECPAELLRRHATARASFACRVRDVLRATVASAMAAQMTFQVHMTRDQAVPQRCSGHSVTFGTVGPGMCRHVNDFKSME